MRHGILTTYRCRGNNSTQSLYSWIIYEWANNQKQVVLNAKVGIFAKPVDLSFRGYIQKAEAKPFQLMISDPLIGTSSQQLVMGAATGFIDAYGKYIGSLQTGIRLNELALRLEQLAVPLKVHFHLLNKKQQIVLSTDKMPLPTQSPNILPTLEKWQYSINKFSNLLAKPIIHNMKRYPFSFITYYPSSVIKQEFLGLFLPRLLQLITTTLLSVGLLLLFRRHFVKPITELSQQALALSQGQLHFSRPQQAKALEIINLSKGLLQVKRYLLRHKRNQKQLEITNEALRQVNQQLENERQNLELTSIKLQEAIAIAKHSDQEKQKFIKQVRNELQYPLLTVIQASEFLLKETKKNNVITNDILLPYLAQIHRGILEIKTLARTSLALEHIDISTVIQESLTIHQKNAYDKGIEIICQLIEPFTFLKADRLRLKQILVGLLYRAIDQTPQNGKIMISCLKQFIFNKNQLLIQIKDGGFGLTSSDERRIKQKLLMNPDVMELDLDAILMLVKLHQGEFHIERRVGDGTCYSVYFPLDEM